MNLGTNICNQTLNMRDFTCINIDETFGLKWMTLNTDLTMISELVT